MVRFALVQSGQGAPTDIGVHGPLDDHETGSSRCGRLPVAAQVLRDARAFRTRRALRGQITDARDERVAEDRARGEGAVGKPVRVGVLFADAPPGLGLPSAIAPARAAAASRRRPCSGQPGLGEPVVRAGRDRQGAVDISGSESRQQRLFGCRGSGATAPARRRRRGTRPAGGTAPRRRRPSFGQMLAIAPKSGGTAPGDPSFDPSIDPALRVDHLVGADPRDRRRGRQDGSRVTRGLHEPARQTLARLCLFRLFGAADLRAHASRRARGTGIRTLHRWRSPAGPRDDPRPC